MTEEEEILLKKKEALSLIESPNVDLKNKKGIASNFNDFCVSRLRRDFLLFLW